MGAVTVAGVGALLGVQSAHAQEPLNGETTEDVGCLQRAFIGPTGTVTNSNKVNCTAGDIRLSEAIEVFPESCIEGEDIPLLRATFLTNVTANSRYDAGFFFRIDGGPNARGDGPTAAGQCSISGLFPNVAPAQNLDGDVCGDLNSGQYELTFELENVACEADPDTGRLRLPNCTSWHSNAGTVCDSLTDVFDFHPDTKSKCVCDDDFTVPVIVETPTLKVDKSASPGTVPESGGTVTFTVVITNQAEFKSVTIESIIDDPGFGDLGSPVPPAGVTDNTCDDLIGDVIPPGGTVSCTFKGFVDGPPGTVTDVVEVCTTEDICDDDSADVTVLDAVSAPTLDKSVTSCVLDVVYTVRVTNTNSFDSLTVSALNDDKFGNITAPHVPTGPFEEVVSTDCASLLTTLLPSQSKSCTFKGRINSCDINHTNTVTATTKDSDEVPFSPSDSAVVIISTP